MHYKKLVVPLSLPLVLIAVAALGTRVFAAPPEGGGHPSAGGVSEPLSPLGKEWKPPIKPASDEGERAMVKFKLPQDLKVSLWAAEPMLADPNALCTDEKGRIYVAETYRYQGGVLDVRDFLSGPRAMLEQDIASRTVEDRVKMVRKTLGAEADKLAVDHDRVVLLEDTNGDGKADKSTVFSDGYNRIEDGLGSGVFAYKGNVYYTCIPCLWLLKDTNNDGKADQRTCLQYGYGVRYAYIGHDLHGMVLGPDGKLYFSVGDRGMNVTKTPDGVTVENPESGAVVRCNLDGTGLELFATGLRNPQELRFDQYGNLFTGDNNPDKGDPARWVYVVEGGDTGWRIGYQHGERPRDGGPWMAEQIWQTEEYNNALYIVPHIAHLGAGPSGLAYYPGTGLPDRYQDTFFLCDFRGASSTSGVWALKNKPKGAGFELVSVEGKPVEKGDLARNSLIHGILCVDIEFGVDGGAYIADWTEGWPRPFKGRVYRVFDENAAKSTAVLETKKLIAEGMGGKSDAELVKLLGHADMRVRQEAQFALAGKGAGSVAALSNAAQKGEALLSRLHAIWGLGQIAAKTPESNALKDVVSLLSDKELEVRCQAAKVLGEGKVAAASEPLVKMLKDAEPRARFFAAMALGKVGKKEAVPAIFDVLKENADKDGHLRHACVQALAWIGDAEPLVAAAKHESPSVRVGAVLALRKMQHGDVAAFLQDKDRMVILEAARAIHDVPIDFAMEQLAAVADQELPKSKGFAEKPVGYAPATTGGVNDWILWRAMNANYRLGTPEGAQRLAKLAANDAVPVPIRVEALRDLGDWDTPPGRDRIMNLWRPLPAGRDAKAARDAAAGVVEKLANDAKAPNEVRVAATNLMRQLGLGDPATLAKTVEDVNASPEVRVAALASLVASKDQRVLKAVEAALKDKSGALRREATRALANIPGGVKRITELLEKGQVTDKQAALAALAASPGDEADALLAQWMDRLIARQVPPELQLDVLEAAEARQSPAVREKLAQHKAAFRDPKDPISYFRETLAGGDVETGRRIFRENAAVSCLRCHTAEGVGGIVGPKLDGVAARQNRDYILESIVAPNAKIAEGFETVVAQTKDNPPRYKTGVLKKEDAKELVLMNPDADPDQQMITIPKDNIAHRERGPSAMPEGLVKALTKRELRDLVEYLASLKEPGK